MDKPVFKRFKTTAGTLRVPAVFYLLKQNGPYPEQATKEKVYQCFCETYEPSVKDINILGTQGTQTGVTMIMRNPMPEFTPTVDMIVELQTQLYRNQSFKIISISVTKENFVKLILQGEIS